MEKRKRHSIYILLMVWLALLLTAFPIFSGSSIAVASNTDWSETVLNNVYNILDIQALNANVAWAVGTGQGLLNSPTGVILKTTDGGATWVNQKTLALPLTSISVVDANVAWASGFGILLKTTDGGATWNTVYSTTGSAEGVVDIDALDANNAWAIYIDSGLTSHIFKTSDGGANWADLYDRPYSSGGLVRLAAVDTMTAWAAGGAVLTSFTSTYTTGPGTIIKTSDGGASWQEQTPAGVPSFMNVQASNASTAWVSGQGVIMRTTDGGATWATALSQPGTEFWGLSLSDGTVWAAGLYGVYPFSGGSIIKSKDGGSTWQTLYTGTSSLCSIDALDAAHAWAGSVGNLVQQVLYGSGNSVILHTLNGGNVRPMITAIAPTSGATGDTVTISGFDFGAQRNSSKVLFNGTEAASYTSWSDEVIKVTVPDGLSGNCEVTAVTATGTSNEIGFLVAAPVSITSIDPASVQQFTFSIGATLSGSGFQTGATVRLVKGAIALDAVDVNVVSGSELTCGVWIFGTDPGAYDVVVTNPDGGTATLAGGFTVTSPCGSGASSGVLALGGMLGLLSLGHGLRRRRRKH